MLSEPTVSTLIWQGLLLGLHAGFAPGPVTTLIVSESLLHGRRAGMRIAFVPLLTDLPVVGIVILLLYFAASATNLLLALFSMVGSLILLYLAYESLTVSSEAYRQGQAPKVSLLKAVGANFFNPNLYIYWLTICGPICVLALQESVSSMLWFLLAFYGSITSVKLLVALGIGSIRHTLNLSVLIGINRFLGFAMLVFATLFFWKGWMLLHSKPTTL